MGEKRSPQGGLCLPPPLSQGHGADVGRALVVAAVAEGITPVGRGPGRDFVVTAKNCFLQCEDGSETAKACRMLCLGQTWALPLPQCPAQLCTLCGAQPASGFTTHVALRAGREESSVPSRAVLSATWHTQLTAFMLQPKKQKKIKSPEVN